MSTQKWELVTWDWLEREIVDCLLIAGQRQEKSRGGSLAGLLLQRPKAQANSAMSQRKQPQERSHA
jgi:hypothetical protein